MRIKDRITYARVMKSERSSRKGTGRMPDVYKRQEMNPKGQARQSKQINTLPFLDMQKVTKNALARAEHKKAVYTPGRFYKFYRVVSKVFPSSFIMYFAKKFY